MNQNDPIRRVPVVSTGHVQIRPRQPGGLRTPPTSLRLRTK
jgi:hypothetical protein